MGITGGLVLIAIGAILRFAVDVSTNGVDVHMIGVILMIVGAVAVVLSLVFWSTWGGFHRREVYDDGRGRRVVDDYR
jgi:Domain of unknown function (DUF6458)